MKIYRFNGHVFFVLYQGATAGLIKSYIGFSICKALQSLIFGYFQPQRFYKVLFLIENILPLVNRVSTLETMLIYNFSIF